MRNAIRCDWERLSFICVQADTQRVSRRKADAECSERRYHAGACERSEISSTLIIPMHPSLATTDYCGRRLAGDAADAECQENRVIVHRRQAASHGPVFVARQRSVEDVMAPPTGYAFSQILTFWLPFARLPDLCIAMSALRHKWPGCGSVRRTLDLRHRFREPDETRKRLETHGHNMKQDTGGDLMRCVV